MLERLVDKGHTVIASGRNTEALDRLVSKHGRQVVPLRADTTSKEAMSEVARTLSRHNVNWAILNAGSCEYVDTDQFSADLIERVMTTNVVGTARSVEAVLPALRATRKMNGPVRLAIVSSSAWWFPFTRNEAYGASKAALSYFASSLQADLARDDIPVTVVSPGFVKTPLTDQNDFHMPFMVSPEFAANAIVTGLERNQDDIEFPKKFTRSLKLLGSLPRALTRRLAARMAESR